MASEHELEMMVGPILAAWNQLAAEEGWPKLAAAQARHNRRALKCAWEGVQGCTAPLGRETPKDLVLAVLQQWNWSKSPAPLGLLENKKVWAALASRNQERAKEALEQRGERLEKVREWTRKEILMRTRRGSPEKAARQETLEFARATGKIKGWTPEELMAFETTLAQER